MPRYAYLAILALGAFGLWIWQDETVRQSVLGGAKQPESEVETRVLLTPTEKSAYTDAIKTAIRERVAIYKGRVRLSAGVLGGTVYVPISLISVSCEKFFGVALKTPGSEGEEAAPVEMILVGPFDGGNAEELQETIDDALDGTEFMDEMCRMVVDEIEKLAVGTP